MSCTSNSGGSICEAAGSPASFKIKVEATAPAAGGCTEAKKVAEATITCQPRPSVTVTPPILPSGTARHAICASSTSTPDATFTVTATHAQSVAHTAKVMRNGVEVSATSCRATPTSNTGSVSGASVTVSCESTSTPAAALCAGGGSFQVLLTSTATAMDACGGTTETSASYTVNCQAVPDATVSRASTQAAAVTICETAHSFEAAFDVSLEDEAQGSGTAVAVKSAVSDNDLSSKITCSELTDGERALAGSS